MEKLDVQLKDIAWGGRIRNAYQGRVWAIAKKAANKGSERVHGNMLTSSRTVFLSFLDGGVSDTRGTFDATSGMHWSGELAKAYIIYQLGLDPNTLLRTKGLPTFSELKKQIKIDKTLSKQSTEGQGSQTENKPTCCSDELLHQEKSVGTSENLDPRSVLIVVPDWPSGTMAFKLGYALQSALEVTRDEMTLIQMSPERIFRVVTSVHEADFRTSMQSKDVASRKILFIELTDK